MPLACTRSHMLAFLAGHDGRSGVRPHTSRHIGQGEYKVAATITGACGSWYHTLATNLLGADGKKAVRRNSRMVSEGFHGERERKETGLFCVSDWRLRALRGSVYSERMCSLPCASLRINWQTRSIKYFLGMYIRVNTRLPSSKCAT